MTTQDATEALGRFLAAEGYRVWTEVPLERVGKLMRADVLALKPGFFWAHADLRIYEIKTSRADFLGDVRRAKSIGYRDYAHRVAYAGPPDVVDERLVPEGLGVVHLDDGAVIHRRSADFRVCSENTGLLLYLMARQECYGPPVDQGERA